MRAADDRVVAPPRASAWTCWPRSRRPRWDDFSSSLTSAGICRIPGPHPTGIRGIATLAAAVSGLLMYRRIAASIFTLRPGAQRLVSRRDLHTVAGTWILPHAFVLAFTGAFFSFAISVGVPVLAKIAFNGDQPAMIEALIGMQKQSDPRPQVSASLDTILTDAYRRADAPVAFISIDHWIGPTRISPSGTCRRTAR